ncbi:SIMPL domain-containing protein [Rufibacter sp. LB8]|uniref:SIMPL domain-containing protein n=1 Tax=Rufibacter sp. LB8 TaxID=2777781 RepID=UPI00178C34B7|nr:SIMPL domain-containing protein [Rufibacter sp. LB8]
MKFFLLALPLFFLTLSAFCQADKKNPTIDVIGSAKITVKPDVGVLIISIKNNHLNFSEAITGLNTKTKDITSQIASIGFKEDDIKTTDFTINKHTVYVKEKEMEVDSGYVAMQRIKVDFKNNKETITKILNTFAKSRTDFTLNFDFKLSDELRTKVQDELIKLAIENSKHKAQLMAQSTGVRLGKIIDISYGNRYYGGMQDLEDKATSADMVEANAVGTGPMMGFTPNDLVFIDNVSIIWSIK